MMLLVELELIISVILENEFFFFIVEFEFEFVVLELEFGWLEFEFEWLVVFEEWGVVWLVYIYFFGCVFLIVDILVICFLF